VLGVEGESRQTGSGQRATGQPASQNHSDAGGGEQQEALHERASTWDAAQRVQPDRRYLWTEQSVALLRSLRYLACGPSELRALRPHLTRPLLQASARA
jgi:hypothetical protein